MPQNENTPPPDVVSGLLKLLGDMNADNRRADKEFTKLRDAVSDLQEASSEHKHVLAEHVKKPSTWLALAVHVVDILTSTQRDRTLVLLGLIGFLLFWSYIIGQAILGTPGGSVAFRDWLLHLSLGD